MRVLRGDPAGWEEEPIPRAVTVGVYDGVHVGHRHVIGLLRSMAADRGLGEVAVVTFDPHPLQVVAPDRVPPLLTTISQRLDLLAGLGIDVAAVVHFDREMRERTPAAFVDRVLGGALGARLVVVGEDFRFGRDRTGNVASLAELGDVHGFEATVVPLVGGERPMSSSAIRELLAAGDVAGAAVALGRPHELRGTVVRGDGRGASIGFPTANLELDGGIAVPRRGVYAVRAGLAGEEPAPAVANVGVRPTFGGSDCVLEVHLLEGGRDLYGAELRVHFVDRIRDERRFDGPQQLVDQIRRDARAAGVILAS